MSAHTPAPWSVNPAEQSPIIGYDVGDGGAALPIVGVIYGRDSAMIDANVRLIAAAPELYSALLALEQAYSNKHSPQHRASCLIEARTVLAKVSA
jgi:hypothetical protein